MNADEIVKALRCYASDCGDDDTCGQCTFAWMCEEMDGNAPKIIADLIESLQAQLADYHHMSELVDGKMGENQRLRRINENLQEQLAESQSREKAAREDLKRFSACCQCNANIDGSCCDMFDGTAENKYFCSNWQWRGLQDEKGENNA